MCYLPGGSSVEKQPAPMGHGLPHPREQHCSFAVFEGFYSTSDFGLSLLSPPLLTFGISELTPSLLCSPLSPPAFLQGHKLLFTLHVRAGVCVAGQTSSDQLVIKAFPAPSKTSHCCQTLTRRRCSLSIGKVMHLITGPGEMSVPCTSTCGWC